MNKKIITQLLIGVLVIGGMGAAIFYSQKYMGKKPKKAAFGSYDQTNRLEKIAEGMRKKE